MKKHLLIVLGLCTALSCSKKPEQPVAAKQKDTQISKAAWLTGIWGNTSAEGNLVENWHKVNDSVYHGESFFIVGKDTVFAESVLLDEIKGKMAYTVTVIGQNDEKPVRFEMTSITDKQMIFENPAHDFPSKIIYKNVDNDSLIAEISGIRKGKPAKEVFKMKRKQ